MTGRVRALSVKVKPNARQSKLEPSDAGSWTAWLKAPPVDGKANDELIALIAAHFGVRKSQVTLTRGASARLKRLEIAAD